MDTKLYSQWSQSVYSNVDKGKVEVNLDALPRPLAQAVRYLADLSWQTGAPDVLIPTSDAARMLSISRSTLNYWCRAGKVKAIKSGRAWRVSLSDARSFLLTRKSV